MQGHSLGLEEVLGCPQRHHTWDFACFFARVGHHCATSRQKPFAPSQGLCRVGVSPSASGLGAHKGHILSWLLACSQHKFFCGLQGFYRKGKVLLEMGRRAEALLAWEHCLVLSPHFQPVQREMEKVCRSAEWWVPCTPVAQGCALM